jgi:Flp pilus assembly protein TadD/ketosteroid isomerase-like protein
MRAQTTSRRTLFALAFAVAALACGTASADDIQEASKLLRAGQHAQALERVNKVLAAKPRDPQARFLKGLIFTEQGNTKEAIVMFQKLTEDFPELPEPYNNLAVIYASQGQYDRARSSLEQSIRTHPSYATAYENLGDVYAKLASQAYDKALQLDSSNATAQNKLALVRDLVGAPRSAKPAAIAQKEAAKPEPAKPEPAKPAAVVAAADPKPQAEKPAPTPAKPAADASEDVIKAVNAWAAAWSKKDVDGYLSSYAKDFKTPGGEARADWEDGRRKRITAPKSISVAVDAPKVTLNGDQATVTFRQSYRSDLVKSTGGKTLVLAKVGGRWLIQQERVN